MWAQLPRADSAKLRRTVAVREWSPSPSFETILLAEDTLLCQSNCGIDERFCRGLLETGQGKLESHRPLSLGPRLIDFEDRATILPVGI